MSSICFSLAGCLLNFAKIENYQYFFDLSGRDVRILLTTENQGGIYYGYDRKKQHVGNQHTEHTEQEFQCTLEEPAEGILGHEDQQRS